MRSPLQRQHSPGPQCPHNLPPRYRQQRPSLMFPPPLRRQPPLLQPRLPRRPCQPSERSCSRHSVHATASTPEPTNASARRRLTLQSQMDGKPLPTSASWLNSTAAERSRNQLPLRVGRLVRRRRSPWLRHRRNRPRRQDRRSPPGQPIRRRRPLHRPISGISRKSNICWNSSMRSAKKPVWTKLL